MTDNLPAVVSTDWLASQLNRANLRVIDGSWYLPNSGRDAAAEYASGHIPGAIFFDLDASSDAATDLPHMLPPEEVFASRMTQLGLNDSDDLVVYDGSGTNLSAPRVWWMFRTFGHHRVAVLDGGINKWRREGRRVEAGVVRLPAGSFTAKRDPLAVLKLSDVRANLSSGERQLVDTRSAGRFSGAEPEPRPGLRRGHVPGSLNLPYNELVADDGTILPPDRLRRRLMDAGIDLSRPVAAMCGSGTSACSLLLALHLIGHQKVSLYDGAWAEWGGRSDTPVANELGK